MACGGFARRTSRDVASTRGGRLAQRRKPLSQVIIHPLARALPRAKLALQRPEPSTSGRLALSFRGNIFAGQSLEWDETDQAGPRRDDEPHQAVQHGSGEHFSQRSDLFLVGSVQRV